MIQFSIDFSIDFSSIFPHRHFKSSEKLLFIIFCFNKYLIFVRSEGKIFPQRERERERESKYKTCICYISVYLGLKTQDSEEFFNHQEQKLNPFRNSCPFLGPEALLGPHDDYGWRERVKRRIPAAIVAGHCCQADEEGLTGNRMVLREATSVANL